MKFFYKIFIFIALFLALFSSVAYSSSVSPLDIMPSQEQQSIQDSHTLANTQLQKYKILLLIKNAGFLLSIILIPIGIIFGIISLNKGKKSLGICLIVIPIVLFIISQLLGIVATASLI